MTLPLATSTFVLVAAVLAAGSPSTAWAIDDDAMKSPPAPAKTAPPTQPGQGGFLSGPSVPADAGKGDGSFGAGDGKRGARGDRFVMVAQEAGVFREAMASVLPSLSEDQRTQIEKLGTDFLAEVQTWRTANADKIKAIQDKMGEMRSGGKQGRPAKGAQPGDAPPKGQSGQPGQPGQSGQRPDPAMREEMEKLKSTMPKFEPVREKIMALLTPEQQTEVKETFTKLRGKRGAEGQGRPGKDGKNGKGGPDAPGKAPPPADPPKGDYKFND